jgi:hypothetical protein
MQIDKAYEQGLSNAVVNAKIIVASRNTLADSLQSLGTLLNSELDKLEGMLSRGYEPRPRISVFRGQPNPQPDPQELYDQIRVLRDYWSAREDTIATSIKKVLVDLGIL